MERLKDSVFHANIDRSGLERITPDILQTNRIMSGTLSAVATLLTGVMFILSFCVEGFSQNRFVYLFGVILSATVLLLTKLSKQYEWLVTPVVYAAYSIYYLYGIFIGTITDPGNRTNLYRYACANAYALCRQNVADCIRDLCIRFTLYCSLLR